MPRHTQVGLHQTRSRRKQARSERWCEYGQHSTGSSQTLFTRGSKKQVIASWNGYQCVSQKTCPCFLLLCQKLTKPSVALPSQAHSVTHGEMEPPHHFTHCFNLQTNWFRKWNTRHILSFLRMANVPNSVARHHLQLCLAWHEIRRGGSFHLLAPWGLIPE